MSQIYEEFLLEMATIRRKAKGNPHHEFNRLLLVALEREKMVTVSYRESLMLSRLQTMPLDEDVKLLIRHALVWIWRDEDMHTIYTRGALMKSAGLWQRLNTFSRQAAGAVGGWAASVVHHVPFRRAPFGWTMARVITGMGKLTGKIPKAVRSHVRYGSFRDFCNFNIDAERTAQICWERILELARDMPGFNRHEVNDFARVAFDEDRHCQIFQILLDALDEQDRLVPGENAETLRDKIGQVSEYFLPRQFRKLDPETAPLGFGGKVWVLEDREEKGELAFFRKCLDQSDLLERLESRRQALDTTPAQLQIVVKPSFILGTRKADLSPVTNPQVLQLLAQWLHNKGYTQIKVLESDNIYDRFFANRDAVSVGKYFGFESEFYELVNISQELEEHTYTRGMGAYSICKSWKTADFRLSLGKLRSHPTELANLSFANLEWMGNRLEDFIFLDRQADRRTANMMLLDEFPPNYAILEGYSNCPDGLVGIMGCKNPKSPHRFYLGRDAFSVDRTALRHMGLGDSPRSSTMRAADHWFGGWTDQIAVMGTDSPLPEWRNPTQNRLWSLLSLMSFPMYMLFSKRGSLFVARMDEAAFPPIDNPGWLTRTLRNFNRMVIGLNFGSQKDS